jgi:hypothetical protein
LADREIKRGDTYPFLTATLSDVAGSVNLTGADVRLILKTKGVTPTIVVDQPCTIVDALQGQVEYEWAPADTSTVNTLDGEFEVTWADGEITTFPTSGYFEVVINPDLG